MIVLDASLLIAYLSPEDPHHVPSKSVLSRVEPLAAHTITLAEALVRGAREGRVDELVTVYAALGITEMSRVDDEPRRLAELRAATGLRLPDCCVLLVAEATGASLATFDDRLAQMARARRIAVLDATPGTDV